MRTTFTRLTLQRSLAWLLCLAVLVPVAQSAALWHGWSHVLVSGTGNTAALEKQADKQAEKQAEKQADKQGAQHARHCDLCLVAAAVSGGAWATAAHKLPYPLARHAAPHAAVQPVWLASAAPAYRSRAPPHAAR